MDIGEQARRGLSHGRLTAFQVFGIPGGPSLGEIRRRAGDGGDEDTGGAGGAGSSEPAATGGETISPGGGPVGPPEPTRPAPGPRPGGPPDRGGAGEEEEAAEPADIEVASIGIGGRPLRPGENATISVSAVNTGGQSGSDSFTVRANGSRVTTVSFSLDANGRTGETISFTVPDAPEVTVEAGGESATANVRQPPPADVSVADVSIRDIPLRPGGSGRAVVEFVNQGGRPGDATATVTADGQRVGTARVRGLSPGGTAQQALGFRVPEADSVTIAADGAERTFNVQPRPPDIGVTDVSIQGPLTVDDVATAAVTASNTGGQRGTASVPVTVNGTEVGSAELAVDAGGTARASISFRVPEADSVTVTAGDTTATADVGRPPANVMVTTVDAPATTTAGERVTVEVRGENIGGQRGSRTVEVTANDRSIGTVELAPAPGETVRDTVVFTPQESGPVVVEVAGTTQTIQVEPPAEGLPPGEVGIPGAPPGAQPPTGPEPTGPTLAGLDQTTAAIGGGAFLLLLLVLAGG